MRLLLNASFPGSVAAGREAARTINTYTLWFLNHYLKDFNEPMPAKADYPRITGFYTRHVGQGNLCLGDGSVQQATTPRLREYLRTSGDTFNDAGIGQ